MRWIGPVLCSETGLETLWCNVKALPFNHFRPLTDNAVPQQRMILSRLSIDSLVLAALQNKDISWLLLRIARHKPKPSIPAVSNTAITVG